MGASCPVTWSAPVHHTFDLKSSPGIMVGGIRCRMVPDEIPFRVLTLLSSEGNDIHPAAVAVMWVLYVKR